MSTEVIASLLGAIVGGLIAFLPALHVLRRQERYKVFSELVATFSTDIRLLQFTHPDQSPEYKRVIDIFRERYPQHHDIVLRASYLMAQKKGDALVKALHELTAYDPEKRIPTFSDYDFGDDHEKEVVARRTATQRIHSLLEIARVR